MKERVIINNLTDSKPARAVQLADGRWITEYLARSIDRTTIITVLTT